jgi:Cys-rich protein (TIGR01571 family)
MYLELDALKAYKSKSWDKGICMQLAKFDRILEYITRAVWLLSHGKSSLLILTCSFQIYFLLQEAPCGDLTTHLFCHLCAICQEYREIRERTDSGSSAPTVTPPAIQTMDEP